MRVAFAILLFICVFTRPMIEFSSIMYYHVNMDEIIEKFCVNKSRPALRCYGKCHLNSKINYVSLNEDTQFPKNLNLHESFIPLFFENYTLEINGNNILSENISHNWKPYQNSLLQVIISIDPPPKLS